MSLSHKKDHTKASFNGAEAMVEVPTSYGETYIEALQAAAEVIRAGKH